MRPEQSEQQKQEALQNYYNGMIKKLIDSYFQSDKSDINTKLHVLSALLINGNVPESHRSDVNLRTLQDLIDPRNKTNTHRDFNTIKEIVISELSNKIYNGCQHTIENQFDLTYSIPQILAWLYQQKIWSIINAEFKQSPPWLLTCCSLDGFFGGRKNIGINLAEFKVE